jgi:gliding motility-associated-like protein
LELGPDQTIYQEESATITATGAITSGSIIWTPTSTLSCGNCITTVASPITTTSYLVSYKNPDECVTLDTITVNVIPIVGLFFPSAFSPNKDGINDEFLALGDSVKAYELSIFNRWGELLFSTTDRYATWNGIYNGSEQPTDSYVYVAHATLYNNKKKDYNGTFSLLR